MNIDLDAPLLGQLAYREIGGPMAEVPQQEPARPDPKKRAPAKWVVFEVPADTGEYREIGIHEARNAEAACWLAAESSEREQATTLEGIRLVAVKASEIDPKTYRLRSTVERVKA